METTLASELERRGLNGRAVSIDRLRELQDEIESRHRTSSFDAAFSDQLGTHFDFAPPRDLQRPRSLIVAAVGDRQVRFSFSWNGSRRHLVVPPTYLHAGESDQRVEAILTNILEPEGYRVRIAALPKKLLAVRSGLAEYGRNNIAYVPGMGSLVRLTVFYSDMPCEKDEWQEPTMMDRCRDCSACRNICPTGAITGDRFLLRAELCTTFHNEQPAHVDFPSWLDRSCHHCLVGCLHCQRVCPENRDVRGWIEEGAEFSAQETAALANGIPRERLPSETVAKIERWDLNEIIDLFPRNLKILLDVPDPRS
jgi:epoxyqueuosine reductase